MVEPAKREGVIGKSDKKIAMKKGRTPWGRSNSSTEKEVESTACELVSELYIPNVSMPYDKLKEMFQKIVADSPKQVKIAFRLEGGYYVFNSLENLEKDERAREYIESPRNPFPPKIRLKDVRFDVKYEGRKLTFCRSVKLIGDVGCVREKKDLFAVYLKENYHHSYGRTLPQFIVWDIGVLLLFCDSLLLLLYAYLYLFYNPHLFPALLADLGVSREQFTKVFVIYIVLLVFIILVLPCIITFYTDKLLSPWDPDEFEDAIKHNRQHYGFPELVFGILFMAYVIMIDFFVQVSHYNFFTGTTGIQASSQSIQTFFTPLQAILVNDGWTILVTILGIAALLFEVFQFWELHLQKIEGASELDDLLP